MVTLRQNRPVTPTSIIAARLEKLSNRVEQEGWNVQIKEQLNSLVDLAVGLDPYIEACTSPESPALKLLMEATNGRDWDRLYGSGDTTRELESEMLSGHVEGQFLRFLVSVSRAKSILEIGMFTGYATLAMAEALPHDGKIVACEIDPYAAEFAEKHFNQSDHAAKIDVLVGPAVGSINQLAAAGQQFDLIFVDAEKSGYVDYVTTILDKNLLSQNGFIVVDNTLMQGQPYCENPTSNGEAIKKFNQYLADEKRVEQVLIPLRDGLTLIRRAGIGK